MSVSTIPIVSQVKSLGQAISGDSEGARRTQEEFSRRVPVISQTRSLVEAAAGDPAAARRTQEAFLHKTLEATPVVSQVISGVYAIKGDTAEAKRIQQQFMDSKFDTLTELCSLSWLYPAHKLSNSTSLSDRRSWMAQFSTRRLHEMLLPGSHDSATYRFRDLAYITDWAQAQTLSIYEQLIGGVRYLDIRVKMSGDTVYCSHTFPSVPLNDVLTDINQYLKDSEYSDIVVVRIAGDDDNTAKTKAEQQFTRSDFANRVLISSDFSKRLGDITSSKKNVLLTNNGFTVKNSWDASAGNTNNPNPVKVVEKCIDYAKTQTREEGTLILLACEATPFGSSDLHKMETIGLGIAFVGQGLSQLAQWSNDQILHDLLDDQQAVAGANVINMDFVNDEIISKIIDLN